MQTHHALVPLLVGASFHGGCASSQRTALVPDFTAHGEDSAQEAGSTLTEGATLDGAPAVVVASPGARPEEWVEHHAGDIHVLDPRTLIDGPLRTQGLLVDSEAHDLGNCLAVLPDVDGDGRFDIGACAGNGWGWVYTGGRPSGPLDAPAGEVRHDYFEEVFPALADVDMPVRGFGVVEGDGLVVGFDGYVSIRDSLQGVVSASDPETHNFELPELDVGEDGTFETRPEDGWMLASSVSTAGDHGVTLWRLGVQSGPGTVLFEWDSAQAVDRVRARFVHTDDGAGDAIAAVAPPGVRLWFEPVESGDADVLEVEVEHARDVATGDVDGDGTRDLVVSTMPPGADGEILLFRGPLEPGRMRERHADVRFDASVPLGTFGGPVHVGDYDGDGRAEILVGSPHAGVTEEDQGVLQGFSGVELP